MATYQKNKKDELVTCPFNPAHRFSKKKLPIHIIKCQKTYPDKVLLACPFNASHRVLEEEKQHHMDHCTDKRSVERHMIAPGSDCGNTAVPAYKNDIPSFQEEEEEEENWDKEPIGRETLVLGQLPNKSEAGEPRFRTASLQLMTPAEKKRHYSELPSAPVENGPSVELETPRQPKEKPKLLEYFKPHNTDEVAWSAQGMQAQRPGPKIAANFPSKNVQNQENLQFTGVGRGVSGAKGVPLLGIGRGRRGMSFKKP